MDTKAIRRIGVSMQAAKAIVSNGCQRIRRCGCRDIISGLVFEIYPRSSKRNSNDWTNSQGNTRAIWSIIYRTLKTNLEFWGDIRGCESWTVKKAECWKIGAFELWCWRRLLRVLWTAGRSNQSILKEISPGCSLEGLMLKLKLQYFGHLMRRVDSEKDPDAGRDWGQEEKGATEDEMARWHHRLDGHVFE